MSIVLIMTFFNQKKHLLMFYEAFTLFLKHDHQMVDYIALTYFFFLFDYIAFTYYFMITRWSTYFFIFFDKDINSKIFQSSLMFNLRT